MYRQAAGTMGRVLLAYAGIGAIGSGVGRTLLNAWDEMNPECYDNEEFDVLCYINGNIEKERQKRNFGLVLSPISPDKSPFHRNLSIIEDGVPVEMNPHDFIYEGHVEGEEHSRVYGSVFDGLFDGQIYLSDGSAFTVEKKLKYNNKREDSSSFHSRIVQVDHKLYKEIFKREGKYCINRTREEIISMFYNHMRTVNDIYEKARIDGMPSINFSVKQITAFKRIPPTLT
ncbi:hypothetical protein PRIPAC_84290 [Pristionchus pacificus]|uniref:Uncharacterized protein n=1 Tax=Pristionchus pacificus TaxID=54126 RepID=A0A2A6BS91_PRIPA|nr:hypothetical protein PRIPAC_84290 [Pristionchus pacificus]|eukprot:PDM68822.1 hypothetical protein PRIPAC_47124 [Pristionchus pacificus]